MSDQIITPASEDSGNPPVPEHLQAEVEELRQLRGDNSEKLQKLQQMAQTDVATSISITRLNQIVDYLFGDGEDRLRFELHFEKNVNSLLDKYQSLVAQQVLTQGINTDVSKLFQH